MRLRPSHVLVLSIAFALGCGGSKPRVVLYCAQDREFAEELLAAFETARGIEALPKFDTEADKSVSLYRSLVRERNRPRCDVFWNNEILSTLRLRKLGMLEPYEPTHAKSLTGDQPDDHSYHAFAERARVLIVNTDLVTLKDRPASLFDLETPRFKDRVVLSRPQFGTGATQAACLFEALGPEKAKEHYLALKANGVLLAPGNKQVAEWVARGHAPGGRVVAVGITDTDDAIAEVLAKKPVAIVFPDRDGIGTLFIPNTIALMRGGPNPSGARLLIDFVLSPETERKLAVGESRQFPLFRGVAGPDDAALKPAADAKRMKVDFAKAAEMWDEVQEFLRHEFASADGEGRR